MKMPFCLNVFHRILASKHRSKSWKKFKNFNWNDEEVNSQNRQKKKLNVLAFAIASVSFRTSFHRQTFT